MSSPTGAERNEQPIYSTNDVADMVAAVTAQLDVSQWLVDREDSSLREKEGPSGDTCQPGLRLVPASSVKPVRIDWAWQERIPIGMVTLLVGQGGTGKSTELCRLAAGWSRGTIDGDFLGVPVNVAIASAEDHRAAVIVPRLLAAGADLSRITFIENTIDGSAGDVEIDGQVEELERTLMAGGVRVLMVDTVIAHIPGHVDTYKEQHVRRVLKPLARLAERGAVVVLGTMHLNRRDSRDVLSRISGSGGFGNLARSVLLFAEDPDDPGGPTRILAPAKSNAGPPATALALRVEGCSVVGEDGSVIPTSRLVVVGESSHTAADLLAGDAGKGDRAGRRSAALVAIFDVLGNGPIEAVTARSLIMEQSGASSRTVDTARKDVGVIHFHRGFGKERGPSFWRLPDRTTQPIRVDRNVRELASYGDSLRPTEASRSPLAPPPGGADDQAVFEEVI